MLRRLLFWAAVPLMLPQGLAVKWRAPRFSHAPGPVTGSVGRDSGLRLVGLGDSVIAGVGLASTEQSVTARTAASLSRLAGCGVQWRILGRSGATAREVTTELLPGLDAGRARAFLVSVGVNDVTTLTRSGRWRRDLERLLDAIQDHSPGAVAVVLGVPPLQCFPLLPRPLRDVLGLRARGFDALAASICAGRSAVRHLPYEDRLRPEQFGADGYHPAAEACIDVGNSVAMALSRLLDTGDAGTRGPDAHS